MLTKNNSFVRSIAMLLAVLMVMALCLTGCGNKAADEALTKAEEAKTLADEVNAALADYLKTADAETTVKALVDAALADGVATKAEIAELAAQLANYVTSEQVEALITEKVAASAVKDAVTMEQINEILSKYYNKDDIDAMFDNYFGEFEAEQVLAILTNADKAMNKSEWDKATAVVLATIEKLQTLLTSLKTKTYTQANMEKVNECLAPFGITVFEYDAKTERYEALKGKTNTVDYDIAKLLEYSILRQATVEDMSKFEAAIEAAVAVSTFESSFAALKTDLYALGDLYVVGKYVNNEFKPAEYEKDDFYHGVAVKAGDLKKVQIVTLADKAAFHAFTKAYDQLLAEYYVDGAYATGAEGWIPDLTVSVLYETTTLENGVKLATKPVDETVSSTTHREIALTMLNTEAHASFLAAMYQNKMDADQLFTYPLIADAKALKKDKDVEVTTETFETFWNDLAADHDEENKHLWETVYTLAFYQLKDVQKLAVAANKTFNTFLKETVKENTLALLSKDFDNITDDEFLAALTGAMCEKIYNEKGALVIDETYYLLDGVQTPVETFLTANGGAYDETVGGFVRSALYEAMMDKTFDLLWDKYKVQAIEWANVLLKDYISVAYEAKNNKPGKVTNVGQADAAIAVTYKTVDMLVGAMKAAGEITTAEELTAGFLNAFLMGGELDSDMYKALGLAEKFKNNNLLAFYENNGEAVVTATQPNTKVLAWDKVFATPLESIANDAENIRQRLTGAMTRTELAIAQADMATAKANANGASVREAFYDLLKAGVEDLDEIYARFLLEDYKKMTYNNMVVKAEKIVTFYNIYNTKDLAKQIAQVERYLVGVASEILTADDANTIYKKGIAVEYVKNDKGANTDTIKSVTYKANDMEDSLTNGYLLTAFKPITADKWAASNVTLTEKNAAGKMEEIAEIVKNVTATIENMVIKANFLDYLQEARGDVVTANVNYTSYLKTLDATNWDILIKLNVANNTADDQITVTEFYFNRDTDSKLAEYKDAYKNILKLVADKNNLHLALLDNSIDKIVEKDLAGQKKLASDVFAKKLEEVKSSADKNWVVGPFVPVTGYEYVGTYAVELDQIMNAEFQTTNYKDEAGNIVPLY